MNRSPSISLAHSRDLTPVGIRLEILIAIPEGRVEEEPSCGSAGWFVLGITYVWHWG